VDARNPAEEQPGVDFVVGAGSDGEPAEEELATGPAAPPSRMRSYALVALALVALAVIAGVRLTGHHTGAPQADRSGSTPGLPHPVPVPVVGGPQRPVADLPTSAVDVIATDLKPCPHAGDGSPGCSVTHRLPGPITAALAERFPRARAVHGVDEEVRDAVTGRGGLWYREVHARVGQVRLAITVTHRPVETPEEVANLPTVVTFSYADHGLFVHTIAHVADGGSVSVPKLMALTTDRRLRAPAGGS
jgi:hypothetical protein